MKQILYILGLVVLLSGIFTSCKPDPLDAMRENEIVTLDKYIKDNNLAGAKDDATGIYFKLIERSSDTTLVRSGFKLLLEFTITFIDGKEIPVDYYFTTDDGLGHHYEPRSFYVDVSNDLVNQEYVQQIVGLHRGLKKMHVGDKAFMVIPSELAFKAVDMSSTLGIPRFSTLLATVYVKKGYSPAQQQ
ncbi:MAG: FKBP-type peptidyl-prolyl cis-trans isomerase [Prolixibacteraceae bacterium]|nr:FKBP-type peptidyl-prolyl cis-trans isomerase [Prolixibacteraceae bacterium]